MTHVSQFTILCALAAAPFTVTFAQETAPNMPAPPVAAQEAPTLRERAGQIVDQVLAKPAADADVDMRRVLKSLSDLGPKPIETLSPEDARKQPTPADAVNALLRKDGQDPEALKAGMGVKTQDVTYDGAAGPLPARVYIPANADATKPLPVVVYYHGGGWVIANIDVYDAGPRAIAQKAGVIVISAEYRFAPENKFPAAHDDAISAYKWTIKNAAKFGGDASRVAVMGESAGGNLAINVAIAARDQKLQMPVHQILIYPVAGTDPNTPSVVENKNAVPLNAAMLGWFVNHLIRTDADKSDPRLDVVGRADVSNLPATTIITASIDPLFSGAQMLADKLTKAGVPVVSKNYEGVTHEFFGMGAVVAKAAEAQALVAGRLKEAFNAPAGVARR